METAEKMVTASIEEQTMSIIIFFPIIIFFFQIYEDFNSLIIFFRLKFIS